MCRRYRAEARKPGAISGKVQIGATEWRGRHSAGQIIPPNPSSPEWACLNSAGHAACCPTLNAPIAPHFHASNQDILVCLSFTFSGKQKVNS